ncbi:PilW family protein [Thermosyntropha lipolytica]|uniref:PilW family protein n=1 Tax=Thermosyntropha lipolytica TaxID=54294 RepID=UPI0013562F9D|nr:prepilin-type N-terminal cleavage/methylation domain-containing protein [Thermosyntropha lipolytica]
MPNIEEDIYIYGAREKVNRREAGFTLLEVLIALALAVFIAGAALSLFSLSSRAWAYSEEKSAAQYELRMAQDKIWQDIKESRLIKDRPVKIVNEQRLVIEKEEEINGVLTPARITYMLNGKGQLARRIDKLPEGTYVSLMPLTEIKVVPQFEEIGEGGFYRIILKGFNAKGDKIVQVLETGFTRRVE